MEENNIVGVYENLKAQGIELPAGLSAAGLYKPVNQTGNLLFVSGQVALKMVSLSPVALA